MDPAASMSKGLPGDGVDATQKSPSDEAGKGVDALDFVWIRTSYQALRGMAGGPGE